MAGGFGEREGMLGDTRGGAGVGSCHGARPSAGTLSLGCARSRSWRTITPPQPSPFYSMKGVTFWRAWTWTCDLLCGACAWRGGGQAATPGWRAPEVACVSLGGARGLIIDMILATDMAKHFPFLADFRRLVETRRQQAGGAVDMANATYALARALARCLFSAASALPLRLVFAAVSLHLFAVLVSFAGKTRSSCFCRRWSIAQIYRDPPSPGMFPKSASWSRRERTNSTWSHLQPTTLGAGMGGTHCERVLPSRRQGA